MNYIEYPNFPKVPEELLDSIESILDPNRPTPPLPTGTTIRLKPLPEGSDYRRRVTNDNLVEWLDKNLPIVRQGPVQYQIMSTNMGMHKDTSRFAYLYLLSSGGSNVKTSFYNDDRELLESHVIPEHTWVKLSTHTYHGVTDVESDKHRIAIGIRTS